MMPVTNELEKWYKIYAPTATSTDYWVKDEDDCTQGGISSLIASKDKKKIQAEIKLWMSGELRKAAKKEAGQLFKDIEKLKEEKSRLGKNISDLKYDLKKTKEEIKKEIEEMEKVIEKFVSNISRYQNLDL